jgi:hypothetical protein
VNTFLSAGFLALIALLAVAGARREEAEPRGKPSLPADHDIALYQSVLDGQLRRMDGIDAILSATGLLIFAALSYLLTVDDVKNALIARLIAIALNVPLAITVWAILRYGQSDAPDLEDLDEGLRENRDGAFEAARDAMVDAFVGPSDRGEKAAAGLVDPARGALVPSRPTWVRGTLVAR